MGIHIQRSDILSGSGSPIGKIVPEFVGQDYLDVVARTYYKADGNSDRSWVTLASGASGRFDITDGLDTIRVNNSNNALTIVTKKGIKALLDDVTDTLTLEGPDMNLYVSNTQMNDIKNTLENKITVNKNDITDLKENAVYSGRMNGGNLELLTKNNKVKSSISLSELGVGGGFTKFKVTGVGEVLASNSTNLEIETKRGITTQVLPSSNKVIITGPDLSNFVTTDMIGGINGDLSGLMSNVVHSGKLKGTVLELLNGYNDIKSSIQLSQFSNQNAIAKVKVAGKSDITASNTGDSIEFVAGAGIVLDSNSSTKKITITSVTDYKLMTKQW